MTNPYGVVLDHASLRWGVDVKRWYLECLIMRKIGAYVVIGALAATIVSPSPVSAFGLYFGPFHIGFGHRHRLAHHPHYVATRSGGQTY